MSDLLPPLNSLHCGYIDAKISHSASASLMLVLLDYSRMLMLLISQPLGALWEPSGSPLPLWLPGLCVFPGISDLFPQLTSREAICLLSLVCLSIYFLHSFYFQNIFRMPFYWIHIYYILLYIPKTQHFWKYSFSFSSNILLLKFILSLTVSQDQASGSSLPSPSTSPPHRQL